MNQAEQFAERCWAALAGFQHPLARGEDIKKVLAGSYQAFQAALAQQSRRGSLPPTLEEVKEYTQSRNSSVDPTWFFEFYQNGSPPWHDSRGKPVRAWKQKLIMHELNGGGQRQGSAQLGSNTQRASLGALQIELETVRTQIKAIVNPGGAAWPKTASQLAPGELDRVRMLEARLDSLKQRIACF